MAAARLLITDLNGVVLDTAQAVTDAVNEFRSEIGWAPLSVDQVRGHFGHGVAGIVRGTLPDGVDKCEVEEAVLRHYERNALLFPGARRFLREVAVPVAVVTNAPAALAQRLMAAAGIATEFADVWAGARKPNPSRVLAALDRFGAPPIEAVMLGDQPPDWAAARSAGVQSIGVRWGYGGGHVAHEPDTWVTSFDEVHHFLRRVVVGVRSLEQISGGA